MAETQRLLTQHQFVPHGRTNRKRERERELARRIDRESRNEIYERNAFNMSKRGGTVTTTGSSFKGPSPP